jgi:hypothetical protein
VRCITFAYAWCPGNQWFNRDELYYVEHPDEIERYIYEHRIAEEEATEGPNVLIPPRQGGNLQ